MHEAIAQVPRYCAFPLSKGKQQISLSNPNANNPVNWPSLWLFTLTPLLSFHQTLSGSGYTPGMQQWYLPLSWKDSALVFLPLLLEPEEQIRQPLVAEEVGGYTSKQNKGMRTAGCCPRACQILQICIQKRTTMHKTRIQSLWMQQYFL